MGFKNLRAPEKNTNESPKEPVLKQPPVVNNLSENEERLDTNRDGDEPIKWPQPARGVDHVPMKLKNGG